MKELLEQRAEQLEKIGFVMKATYDNVFYEKNNVKISAVQMACYNLKTWNDFIEQNKPKKCEICASELDEKGECYKCLNEWAINQSN